MLTGYIHERPIVDIIISNTSDKPIYEQISSQIKSQILSGALTCGEKLPSIRALANGVGVSVITTKRAYSDLEAEGFIETVQGKGCFVASGSHEMLREEQLRRIEGMLAKAAAQAFDLGVSRVELHEMLDLIADGESEQRWKGEAS